MAKSVEIAAYIDSVGGVASAAQLKNAGFLPGSIAYALESGAIDKITRGVYCSTDLFEDDFAAIASRWKRCVFSHGSALYLLGLSDRVPGAIDVSVPHGYNPHGLATEYPGIRIHRLRNGLYDMGVIEARSPSGIAVKAYGPERSVADLISQRVKKGADPQLVRDAVAGYFKRRDANLPELARMCEALGVGDEFRMYLEVLG